jgi:hypothetical protein
MKKQIVKVSLVQSGKVIALMYALLTLPFAALIGLFAPFLPGLSGPLAVLAALAIPLAYALFGFVGVVTGGWLYNLAAGMVGGIEYTTSEGSTPQSVTG